MGKDLPFEKLNEEFGKVWDPFKMAISLDLDKPLENWLEQFDRLESEEGYRLVEIPLPPDDKNTHWLLVVQNPQERFTPYNRLIDLINGQGLCDPITMDYIKQFRQEGKVPTSSLRWYVGRHDHVIGEEITDLNNEEQERRFNDAMKIYQKAFEKTNPALVAPPEGFKKWIQRSANLKFVAYHFAILRETNNIIGMASFFTFYNTGFGGYLCANPDWNLYCPLSSYLSLLIAKAEIRMLMDNRRIRGWFVEVEPENDRWQKVLQRFGRFWKVEIEYRQPPLPYQEQYQYDDAPSLNLLYKEFGQSYIAPQITKREFLNAISDIFYYVYGIKNPDNSKFFGEIVNQVNNRVKGDYIPLTRQR